MIEIIGEILKAIIIIGTILAGILAILIWVKNQTKNISYLRTLIQVASVALIFLGLIVGPFGLPQSPPAGNAPRELLLGAESFKGWFPDGLTVPVLACYYPSGRTVTCAIWQIQSYIYPFWNPGLGFWGTFYTSSGIERLAIVFVLLILMSLVLGRFFCGWICPFGLYMDLLSNIRATFKKGYRKFSQKTNTILHQLRYLIIAAFLILSVIFGSQAIFGLQLVPGTQQGEYIYNYFSAPYCQVCPMKPLCTLTETSLGYMDPAYVWESTTGIFYEAGYFLTSLNLAILVLVTILAFAYRRFWCRICPLGGLIALFNRYPPFKWVSIMRLNKVEEKCTKCGICKRVCPPQVTEVYEKKGGDVTTSACILCLRCVEMCPYEDCLKLDVVGKTVFKSRNWVESR
ncbi:MAG: 4Fe-4S binding protein [Candidatus Bathyarchaeales archaeon]